MRFPSKTRAPSSSSDSTVGRRSRSVSAVSASEARSSESASSSTGRRVRTSFERRRRTTSSGSSRASSAEQIGGGHAVFGNRAPDSRLVRARVERGPHRVEPRVDVDADREVERVLVRRQRLVQPPAGHVQHVARLQHEVEHRLPGLPQLRAIALVAERQLERRLVDEPALPACDLQAEHVVRVVVDGQALRAPRREVRVRLNRLLQLGLEQPAERRQRWMGVWSAWRTTVAPLANAEWRARDVDRARERHGPPRDVGRVVAEVEPLTRLDEAERGMAQPPNTASARGLRTRRSS